MVNPSSKLPPVGPVFTAPIAAPAAPAPSLDPGVTQVETPFPTRTESFRSGHVGLLDPKTLEAAVRDVNERFSLDLRGATFAVIPRANISDLVKSELEGLYGANISEITSAGIVSHGLGGLIDRFTAAQSTRVAYLPSTNTFVAVAENVRGQTGDALRASIFDALSTEAVRRATPDFERGIKEAAQRALEAFAEHGKRSPEFLDAVDTLNARFGWVTGVQVARALIAKDEFRHGGITPGTFSLALLALLSSASREKIVYAASAMNVVAKFWADRPDLVDKVFGSPVLADALLKRTGKLTLEAMPGSDRTQVLEAAARLQLATNGVDVQLLLDGRNTPLKDAAAPLKERVADHRRIDDLLERLDGGGTVDALEKALLAAAAKTEFAALTSGGPHTPSPLVDWHVERLRKLAAAGGVPIDQGAVDAAHLLAIKANLKSHIKELRIALAQVPTDTRGADSAELRIQGWSHAAAKVGLPLDRETWQSAATAWLEADAASRPAARSGADAASTSLRQAEHAFVRLRSLAGMGNPMLAAEAREQLDDLESIIRESAARGYDIETNPLRAYNFEARANDEAKIRELEARAAGLTS